jgi:hypothetical protein
MHFSLLFASSILAQNSQPSDGLGIALENSKNFCLIVSPKGSDIAQSEREAKAACYGSPQNAKPGFDIPQSMIVSAHFVKTKHYSQVTGILDGSKFGYKSNDQGILVLISRDSV